MGPQHPGSPITSVRRAGSSARNFWGAGQPRPWQPQQEHHARPWAEFQHNGCTWDCQKLSRKPDETRLDARAQKFTTPCVVLICLPGIVVIKATLEVVWQEPESIEIGCQKSALWNSSVVRRLNHSIEANDRPRQMGYHFPKATKAISTNQPYPSRQQFQAPIAKQPAHFLL